MSEKFKPDPDDSELCDRMSTNAEVDGGDEEDDAPFDTNFQSGLPKGTLFVVATPIGNLEDLSARAIRTLQNSDLILCEDTRHFGRLAQRFGITTPKRSFHEHNERNQSETIIEELRNEKTISLVSDAGTPLISDPGYRLISMARDAQIPVSTVPGPSALIAALSISGFEVDRFYFEGFLPQKSGKRRATLQRLLNLGVTAVCYESPHRLLKTLEELANLAPTHEIMVARELTKIHEEIVRGQAKQVVAEFAGRAKILGEIVLVIRRSDGE